MSETPVNQTLLILMGNHMSCVQFQAEQPAGKTTIRLIKSDGGVKIYHRPIYVAELMVEFPKHRVCRSDSFYIGQKIPALSEDDQLQLGHKYFLLPKHCFQSVLSFVTIASFANSCQQPSSSSSSITTTRDSRNAFLKKAATCQPFDIQKSPSGCLRIRVSEEFLSQLMEQGQIKATDQEDEISTSKTQGRVCTTPQLQKDYTQLVGPRLRQWKPKLDTIRETDIKRKRLSSSFGMNKGKKSQSKGTQTQKTTHRPSERQLLQSPSSTKPCSKPKMKIKIKIKSRT